jgi:hypothetical protein
MPPFHDTNIKILMLNLLEGMNPAVNLNIRHGTGQTHVILPEKLAVFFHALNIIGSRSPGPSS